MAMREPSFKSNKVIEERISDAKLRVFDAGFDQNLYRLQPFAEVIMKTLPEFALGYEVEGVLNQDVYERLKKAAEMMYKTDKYKSRGEFGELILHLLLRDFCNTVPLVSKIYFKDAKNVAVHGFDAIHVTSNEDKKSLWLGEAKMYKIGNDGIDELIDDLKKHFKDDYLRDEFVLVRNKVELLEERNISDKDHWLDLMHHHTTLDKIFSSITVPMLCVYDSDIYKDHNSVTEEYLSALNKEVKALHKRFDDKSRKIRTDLDIILFLVPVPSKETLVDALNTKLKNLQNI